MNKISKLLDINQKLLDVVDKDIAGALHGTKSRTNFSDTCYFILPKSTKTFRAIQHLCNKGIGYGDDAIILVRSILEHLINLSYISSPSNKEDREHRATLFINWLIIDLKRKINDPLLNASFKQLLEERFNGYISKGIDYDGINELHKEECDKLAKDGKKTNKWSWSGLSLRDMAKEIESLVPETKLYSTYYSEVYWLYSMLAHPHPGGSSSYIKRANGRNGIIIHDMPNNSWIEEVLVSSFDCFGKIVALINNVFNLNIAELNDIAKEYIELIQGT